MGSRSRGVKVLRSGHRNPQPRRIGGMASRKPGVPENTEGRLHIRAPWWRSQPMAFCYGRTMDVGFWPVNSKPTKDKSCPRCWGMWVDWKAKNLGKPHPDGYT